MTSIVKPWFIISALFLNLLIFGFFGLQGVIDQIGYLKNYEIFRGSTLFSLRSWVWIFGMLIIAIVSLAGLFKMRWPAIVSTLAGICFFLFMTYGYIDWYFDPMEQGRNGGVLYFALITLGLAGLNLISFITLLKRRYNNEAK